MYSIEMKYSPSTAPSSKMWTMFGWLRRADSFASSTNILMKVVSSERCGRIRLTTNVALEAGRALDAALEHLGHAPAADALEERVLAELDRLGELGCHGKTCREARDSGSRGASVVPGRSI